MRTIDLFAGCGGMSLGFSNAGFNILAAYDCWEPSIKVYRKNFKHKIHNYDLSDFIHEKDINTFTQFNPDIIIGGPPCQDFSSAGKRDENLGRSNLTISFANIVINVLPRVFVMENVDRFIKSNTYQKAKHIFHNSGYGITEIILDASFCSVPQKRKRFFWIGIYNGEEQELLPYLKANLASKPMTVRDYLGDQLGIEHYYRHPRSYKRRGVFSIDEPSPTIRGVNRPIPKNYQQHPGDTAPISENVRPLSTKERSYIQTFPEDFILEGSKTNCEQMIGNAVPVKLAEYVAKSIITYLAKNNKVELTLSTNKSEKSVKSEIQLSLPW